jgi:hypothetical protein
MRWRFVFRHADGSFSSRRGFTSRHAAVTARRQLLEAIDRQEVTPARETFASFWTKLLADKHPYLSTGSMQDFKTHGRKRLLPSFGDEKLAHIDEDRVRGWLADMAELVEAGELAPKTVNNARTWLLRLPLSKSGRPLLPATDEGQPSIPSSNAAMSNVSSMWRAVSTTSVGVTVPRSSGSGGASCASRAACTRRENSATSALNCSRSSPSLSSAADFVSVTALTGHPPVCRRTSGERQQRLPVQRASMTPAPPGVPSRCPEWRQGVAPSERHQ